MAVVGCYTLHLYCNNADGQKQWPDQFGHEFREFPHQYTGEFGSRCRSAARRAGWLLQRSGIAICPKCTKAKR